MATGTTLLGSPSVCMVLSLPKPRLVVHSNDLVGLMKSWWGLLEARDSPNSERRAGSLRKEGPGLGAFAVSCQVLPQCEPFGYE